VGLLRRVDLTKTRGDVAALVEGSKKGTVTTSTVGSRCRRSSGRRRGRGRRRRGSSRCALSGDRRGSGRTLSSASIDSLVAHLRIPNNTCCVPLLDILLKRDEESREGASPCSCIGIAGELAKLQKW
jgi:hypothetical protein